MCFFYLIIVTWRKLQIHFECCYECLSLLIKRHYLDKWIIKQIITVKQRIQMSVTMKFFDLATVGHSFGHPWNLPELFPRCCYQYVKRSFEIYKLSRSAWRHQIKVFSLSSFFWRSRMHFRSTNVAEGHDWYFPIILGKNLN